MDNTVFLTDISRFSVYALFKRQEKHITLDPEPNRDLAEAVGEAAGAKFCQEKIDYGIHLPNIYHSFVRGKFKNFLSVPARWDIQLSTCSRYHTHPHSLHPASIISCFHQAFFH